MKNAFLLFVSVLILNVSAFAFDQKPTLSQAFKCQAGLTNLLNFSANVSPEKIEISFSKRQNKIWQDLAGKTVNLNFNPNRGNIEWKYNVGKLAADSRQQEFIFIEMGYLRSALKNGELIGNFALSPRSPEIGPFWLSGYQLKCK
jgi:hypothetical protein